MPKLNTARGSTGRIAWVFLPDSASTTGGGKTGLTNASAGLNVSVRRENTSTGVTTYTGANVGAVATPGTWADPGSGKVNFKEVDATNLPGVYELHFENALFNAGDTSRWLAGMVQATGVAPSPFEIALDAIDTQDGAAAGLSRLDAAVSSRSTYAGADTAGTTTLLARLTATRAGLLDNLDAAVSSRMATFTLPANFAALGITVGGAVTVGTNNDKTGYALTAAYDPAKTAAQAGDAMTLVGAYDFAKGTVAMAESYRADGAAGSPAQMLYEILENVIEFSISGTTKTVKKIDGTTTAATYTLNDATNPSSITRST